MNDRRGTWLALGVLLYAVAFVALLTVSRNVGDGEAVGPFFAGAATLAFILSIGSC